MREYVEGSDGIGEFYDHLIPLLDYLLPQYEQEGKAHLTIGIGCTGGRHRSVVIAEHLARDYSAARRLHGRRGASRHREAAAHALSRARTRDRGSLRTSDGSKERTTQQWP